MGETVAVCTFTLTEGNQGRELETLLVRELTQRVGGNAPLSLFQLRIRCRVRTGSPLRFRVGQTSNTTNGEHGRRPIIFSFPGHADPRHGKARASDWTAFCNPALTLKEPRALVIQIVTR